MSLPILAILLFVFMVALALLTRAWLDSRSRIRRQNRDLEDCRLRILELEEECKSAEERRRLISLQAEKRAGELQAQLAQSAHFRDFVEGTEEFLFEVDYKGRFLYANPALMKRMGYDWEELARLDYSPFLDPARLAECTRFYTRQYHNRQPYTYAEWFVINRFGENIPIGFRVKMEFDDEGKIRNVKGSGRDLSIQLATRKKNWLFEEGFERFLRKDPVPILIFEDDASDWDPARQKLVWANQSTLDLMNLDLIQVQGLNLPQISGNLSECVSRKLAQPRELVTWKTVRDPDRVFQIRARRDEKLLVVAFLDMTASLQEINQNLSRIRELEAMLEELPIEVAVLSPQGRYQFTNRSKKSLYPGGLDWKGLSDEEWFKSQGLESSIALLRKAKMEEAVFGGHTTRYFEFFPLKEDQLLVRQKEYRLLQPDSSRDSPLLSVGFNATSFFHLLAEARMTLDEWRFHQQTQAFYEGPPLSLRDSLPASGENDGSLPGQGLIPKSESGFYSYPELLKGIQSHIGSVWPDFAWKTEKDLLLNQVVFFPTVLFLQTLSMFRNLVQPIPELKIRVEMSEEGKIMFSFHLHFATGALASSPGLTWLKSTWAQFGARVKVGKDGWQAQFPMAPANRPATDRLEKPLAWFLGKSILVGPAHFDQASRLSSELRSHGAETILVPSIFGLNKHLDAAWYHLVIWWSDRPDEISELDQQLLQASGVKLLVYSDSRKSGKYPPSAVVMAPPRNMREAMEQVWELSDPASIRKPRSPVLPDPLIPAPVHLGFSKFLEITEGDKSFMQGLFPSYFSSLSECREVFAQHLQTRDVEGLRFLLHKIRATINTFEILELDALIRETIDRMVEKQWVERTDATVFYQRLDRICREAESQLRTFAKEQGLDIPA